MKRPLLLLVCCGVFLVADVRAGARQEQAADGFDEALSIQELLLDVETAIGTSNREQWAALLSPNAARQSALEFFDELVPPDATQVTVKERDRQPLDGALPGDGYRLLTDVFIEMGSRGRIHTWSLDIRKPRGATDRQPWRIVAQENLASIDGLHRLGLSTDSQFRARNLVIESVDFQLRLPQGDVFAIDTAEGVTGLVLLGDGVMSFTPTPPEERGQVRIFAGSETLETPFTAAYVRLNPLMYEQRVQQQLEPVPADARTLRRAQAVFDEEVSKSFSLDLRDLSRDNWSLLPQPGDFLAEVRTRRFDTLTFARSIAEAEDVTLFQRARRRNIASYASEMKLNTRGRFFDEDDLVEYDILDYSIDAVFNPDREWLDGNARLKLRVKAFAVGTLTLRLADEFNISSVTSTRLGRLMYLRVRNQDNFVVNLPFPVPRDTELELDIAYAGPVRTQAIDQESLSGQQDRGPIVQPRVDDLPFVPPERKWLFSNRSHWYQQSQVTDYATATLRVTVPAEYAVVGSGVEVPGSPVQTGPGQITHVFRASQPARYLSVVVSRFSRVDRATVALDIDAPRNTVTLMVDANRRQQERGRNIVPTAAEILRFYASIIGEAPYDALTIAMVEDERPGGHSPAYFAMLNNPPPVTSFTTRRDPASFSSFPEFFIAHEIAHQWWGQGVGWKNYHEQWLSEGFAQYFAALYARERRGENTFREVLRQLRRWAMDQSDQGAVYLGYRLGHIKGDSRVFRAVAYNKGAAVLHMLRRLVGDEAFFEGLRQYYRENRYRKAGTDDLRRAMEAVSGMSLDRFFERWIYESGIPRIRYSTRVEGDTLLVRFEQRGETYDLPVTVTLNYGSQAAEHIVAITDAVVEARIPLEGSLRRVSINDDDAALAEFERR